MNKMIKGRVWVSFSSYSCYVCLWSRIETSWVKNRNLGQKGCFISTNRLTPAINWSDQHRTFQTTLFVWTFLYARKLWVFRSFFLPTNSRSSQIFRQMIDQKRHKSVRKVWPSSLIRRYLSVVSFHLSNGAQLTISVLVMLMSDHSTYIQVWAVSHKLSDNSRSLTNST